MRIVLVLAVILSAGSVFAQTNTNPEAMPGNQVMNVPDTSTVADIQGNYAGSVEIDGLSFGLKLEVMTMMKPVIDTDGNSRIKPVLMGSMTFDSSSKEVVSVIFQTAAYDGENGKIILSSYLDLAATSIPVLLNCNVDATHPKTLSCKWLTPYKELNFILEKSED